MDSVNVFSNIIIKKYKSVYRPPPRKTGISARTKPASPWYNPVAERR